MHKFIRALPRVLVARLISTKFIRNVNKITGEPIILSIRLLRPSRRIPAVRHGIQVPMDVFAVTSAQYFFGRFYLYHEQCVLFLILFPGMRINIRQQPTSFRKAEKCGGLFHLLLDSEKYLQFLNRPLLEIGCIKNQ